MWMWPPSIATWRSRNVVSPKLLLAFAYSTLPTRKKRHLHQPHDRGQHPLARQTAALQIRFDAGADQRQRLGEDQQLAVFRLVAHFAPARVIAVLLAAALVAAGRLQMAVRVEADPHIGPGRRDRQRANAPQRLDVAHQRAVRAGGSRNRSFAAMAGDARRGIADIAQPRALRRDLRIQRLRERRVDTLVRSLLFLGVLLFPWRHCRLP